ncbi:MAG: hypothetical protein RL681_412 [Candidatus Parcubacteria bacterium]|jgi:amino acid permease
MRPESFAGTTGILVATTIGAGIFALPYLFAQSGWLAGTLLLAALGVMIFAAHWLYACAVSAVGGEEHLTALSRRTLGVWGMISSFIAVYGGLTLSLVVYIVLSVNFMRLFTPAMTDEAAMALFWLAGSLPLFARTRFFGVAAFLGTAVMGALIVGLWLLAPIPGTTSLSALVAGKALVPFGAILFALAGWTAIPTMMEYDRRTRHAPHRLVGPLAVGTAVVVILYALFVFAVLGSGWPLTPDTISGIPSASPEVGLVIGMLGLFALWTSYVPIALELRDSFAETFGGSRVASTIAVIALPMILVGIGLRDFLSVIGLAGGVFLSLQYALIMAVSRKALRLRGIARLATDAVTLAFVAAALYELYVFVVG